MWLCADGELVKIALRDRQAQLLLDSVKFFIVFNEGITIRFYKTAVLVHLPDNFRGVADFVKHPVVSDAF